MKLMKRIASLCFIAVLGLTGCDPKFGLAFSVALVGVEQRVDARVAAGAITPEKGELVKRDFRDLRDAGKVFDADFKAAEDRTGKIGAAVNFGSTGTAIAERGNLVNLDPVIQNIADISLAIVAEVLDYYAPSNAPRAGAVRQRSEKELKRSVEGKIKELKEAIKNAPTETSQFDLKSWDERNQKRQERTCQGELNQQRTSLDQRPPNK
jgi:hypothetical protein